MVIGLLATSARETHDHKYVRRKLEKSENENEKHRRVGGDEERKKKMKAKQQERLSMGDRIEMSNPSIASCIVSSNLKICFQSGAGIKKCFDTL